MTISGLPALQTKIAAHEAILDKATRDVASLAAEAVPLRSLVDTKKTLIQQIDPKLVGEPRSRSSFRIVQLVSHVFYAMKSAFHARFGSLSSDLNQYQSVKLELEANLAAQKLKTAQIKDLNAEISKLNEQKYILENQLIIYTPPTPVVEIPDMAAVLEQMPVVRLASSVISTASGLFSGVCSYLGSFFNSSSPVAVPLETEASSSSTSHSSSSSSGSSSMSVQIDSGSTAMNSSLSSPRSDDRHSETSSASDSSALDAPATASRHERTGQETFEAQLGVFGSLQDHDLEFGKDLARRFFPPVDNVILNYDKASEGIIILDVTFTSNFKLDTTFKGYKTVFLADKKLRLELNTRSKSISFEPGKFVAQSAMGNFGLTSMEILPSGNLVLSGLPLTGVLSWAIKKPQSVETTAEDFESTFGGKHYVPC